jgi:hypothetical protein
MNIIINIFHFLLFFSKDKYFSLLNEKLFKLFFFLLKITKGMIK